MPIVNTPNGPVNFPDTMSMDEIAAVLRKKFPPPAAKEPPPPGPDSTPGSMGPADGRPTRAMTDVEANRRVRRAPTDDVEKLSGALGQAADTASFGLLPRAGAAISALSPSSGLGQDSWLERYKTEIGDRNAEIAASRERIGYGPDIAAAIGTAKFLPGGFSKLAPQGAAVIPEAWKALPVVGKVLSNPATAEAMGKLGRVTAGALDGGLYGALNAGIHNLEGDPLQAATEGWQSGSKVGAVVPAVAETVLPAMQRVASKLEGWSDKAAYWALGAGARGAEHAIDKFGSTDAAGYVLRHLKMPDGTPLLQKGMSPTEIRRRLEVVQEALQAERAPLTEAAQGARINTSALLDDLESIYQREFGGARSVADAEAAAAARKEIDKLKGWLTGDVQEVGRNITFNPPKPVAITNRGEAAAAEPFQPYRTPGAVKPNPADDNFDLHTRNMTKYDPRPTSNWYPDPDYPQAPMSREQFAPVSRPWGAQPRLEGEDVRAVPPVTKKVPQGNYRKGEMKPNPDANAPSEPGRGAKPWAEKVVQRGGSRMNLSPLYGEPTPNSSVRPVEQPPMQGWHTETVDQPLTRGEPIVASTPRAFEDVSMLKSRLGQRAETTGAARYPKDSSAIDKDPELRVLKQASGAFKTAEEDALERATGARDAFESVKRRQAENFNMLPLAIQGDIRHQSRLPIMERLSDIFSRRALPTVMGVALGAPLGGVPGAAAGALAFNRLADPSRLSLNLDATSRGLTWAGEKLGYVDYPTLAKAMALRLTLPSLEEKP